MLVMLKNMYILLTQMQERENKIKIFRHFFDVGEGSGGPVMKK
jgi:hypothetical protein